MKGKKSAAGFGKFIQQKETGSQKKERIRQEKKVVRKETQAYFEQKKAEARAQRAQYRAQQADDPRNRKGAGRKTGGDDQGEWESGRAAAARTPGKKPANRGYNVMSYHERKKKQADKVAQRLEDMEGGRPAPIKKTFKGAGTKPAGPSGLGAKTTYNKTGGDRPAAKAGDKKPFAKSAPAKTGYDKAGSDRKPFAKGRELSITPAKKGLTKATPAIAAKGSTIKAVPAGGKNIAKAELATGKGKAKSDIIPLNKFLAHSGISSRRESADIIKSGLVKVNNVVVTEPGTKVSEADTVTVNGKPIAIRRTMVYILINKPKDFITTTDDPQGRRTVLDLIKNATTERVYPIGRLDRNTTGVLLLTNDGELAQKLSHPSYQVRKIYEVKLDKPLSKKDFDTILAGVTLEDGVVAPDVLAYADPKDKSVIGIEIHSGRNRIVRRIFEHMGYDVRNLDRVMYANLTKKNVERGRWRFLSEKEVRLLKFLNASYTNKKPATRGKDIS
ncbi:pseudouridine synthase [Paraflavitalea pollutisoli]|uniref:pseudouridine synthase n=1 Tax=Paraflavitalea pollutisoli TaxID=3034143 RepID=UPI0023EABE15|nr:pseudouridine synthase [Paraflavitalea sp. H1-2-19X]